MPVTASVLPIPNTEPGFVILTEVMPPAASMVTSAVALLPTVDPA